LEDVRNVPFGHIETAERRIAWLPRGDVVMDVFGFREALDMRLLLDDVGIGKVSAILSEQSNHETLGLLPTEMSAHEPERARALLEALLKEMLQGERRAS
jgi:hypothetical protein